MFNKKLVMFIMVALLIGSIGVTALTFSSLGGGRYLVTFNDGKNVTVNSVDYNSKTKILTIDVNTGGKGLSMQEVMEAREFAMAQKGRLNKYDWTVVTTN